MAHKAKTPDVSFVFVCFPRYTFACCRRCTVTCFCFYFSPISLPSVFPLFWDGPNYSSPMCGWTLWQNWEASHSPWLTHPLACSPNLSLCHSSAVLIYIHSHSLLLPKMISVPLSLSLSLLRFSTLSTHINLTLTGICCSHSCSCLFWACITVIGLYPA